MGAQLIRDVASEPLKHAQGILEPVPARDLDHQRDSWGNRLVLDQLGPAPHPTRAPIQAPEHRLPRVRVLVLQDPGRSEDGVDRGRLQGLVLGGEGVDAGGDDGQPRPIQPLPAVGGAGEDIGVGLLDSGP
jgi:hypothetical protein